MLFRKQNGSVLFEMEGIIKEAFQRKKRSSGQLEMKGRNKNGVGALTDEMTNQQISSHRCVFYARYLRAVYASWR